jgi:5-oxoprolinase (ATP-hydrolysing) subunit A
VLPLPQLNRLRVYLPMQLPLPNSKKIDLNADVGEGLPTDAGLMPFISSANIACGFHAGDADTIRSTIELCLQHNVAVGAHPSFADRENFGRTEMVLPPDEIRKLVLAQLRLVQNICNEMGATLHHVKPHGALYNMSARNPEIACAIAESIHAFNPSLILYGLSGSHSVAEGVMAGLKTAAEVFADRTYQQDGSLTPRNQANALILSDAEAVLQAKMLVLEQKVRAVDGTCLNLMAETICLHGDGPYAVSFARKLHQLFTSSGISVQAV